MAIFNLEGIIRATGYLGIAGIVYTESGLLIGLFLPGDSLLFTAGFLASQGFLNIWVLATITFIAAVLGDSTGYSIGRRFGHKVFKRKDSLFFDKKHLQRSEDFYKKHGGKTIILARFMPIVRTFAPLLAGVGKMNYRTFFSYNILGGFLWSFGITFLGYFLGKSIPDIDKYLLPIILLIVAISIAPSAFHILKDPDSRRKIFNLFKKKRL